MFSIEETGDQSSAVIRTIIASAKGCPKDRGNVLTPGFRVILKDCAFDSIVWEINEISTFTSLDWPSER